MWYTNAYADSDANGHTHSPTHCNRDADGDPHCVCPGDSYTHCDPNADCHSHRNTDGNSDNDTNAYTNQHTEASSNTQTSPKPAAAPDTAAIKLNEVGNKDDLL